MIRVPIGAGREGRQYEKVEFVSPRTADVEKEARKLVDSLLNDSTARFCAAFAKAWCNWHREACEAHDIGYNSCRKNMLCDCCDRRFKCYTEK